MRAAPGAGAVWQLPTGSPARSLLPAREPKTPREPRRSRRSWVPALHTASSGRARHLRPGDHTKAALLEIRISVWLGAAIESVPPLGPGQPLPPIVADFDRPRTAVEGGPGPPQFGPITGDYDEPPPHGASPPMAGRTTHARRHRLHQSRIPRSRKAQGQTTPPCAPESRGGPEPDIIEEEEP